MFRPSDGGGGGGGYEDDELLKIIRSLSHDYDLAIRSPFQELAPSERRKLLRSDHDELTHSIVERIRFLHYKHSPQLSALLGRFRAEAQRQSSIFAPSKPPHARRKQLCALLLSLLKQEIEEISVKRCNRKPIEGKHPQSKRVKTSEVSAYDLIDSLPSRSSQLTRLDSSSTTATRCGKIYSPDEPKQEPLSFLSSVQHALRGDAAISRPGHEGNNNFPCPRSIGHQVPLPTNLQQVSEDNISAKSCSGNRRTHLTDSKSLSFPGAAQSKQALEQPLKANGPLVLRQPTLRFNHEGVWSLEQRLKSVWPKTPTHGLTEAPLAVLWELTRIALHCDVDLSKCDLKYDSTAGSWTDQTLFRTMLASLDAFRMKKFPPASEDRCWKLANNGFLSPAAAVKLSATLAYRVEESGPAYRLRLNPLEIKETHRLARRFGADRFLEVAMPSPNSAKHQPLHLKRERAFGDKVVRWLTAKPHRFLGRLWVPYFTRPFTESTKVLQNGESRTETQTWQRVFFFASNGDTFRKPAECGQLPVPEEASDLHQRTSMSLHALLDWALDLSNNVGEPALKLFSRISLSLTPTVPAVTLSPDQIRHSRHDIGSCKVMNDGCGLMSRCLARKVADALGLERNPCAFQARLGSAKGMWVIDVNDDGLNEDVWIQTFPSQRKWACDFVDAHHRTFEVKSWPREALPAKLNRQFIVILEAQARDRSLMRQLLAENLNNDLRSHLEAHERMLQHPAEMRLHLQESGLSGRRSPQIGHVSFLGGQPYEREDRLAYLLDSGFDVRTSKIAQKYLWELSEQKARALKTKTHFTIPHSANLLMLPDFTSTLEEGEVHVSFSTAFDVVGFCDTGLEDMDVLVGRSPAHLPSDVQKVRAVSVPKLRKAKDVIFFSTRGKSSLADKLSGGDYDGDKAWICWDRRIVDNFRNSPVPQIVDLINEGYLQKQSLTLHELTAGLSSDEHVEEFVYYAFVFSMQPSLLGPCTIFKERYSYLKKSIKDPNVILMSGLLSLLVDQAKQGIKFDQSDWDELRQRNNLPSFLREPDYELERCSRYPRTSAEEHILDCLKFEVAESVICDALKKLHSTLSATKAQWYDEDLTAMANGIDDALKGWADWVLLRKKLHEDLEEVRGFWISLMGERDDSTTFVSNVKLVYEAWLRITPLESLRAMPHVKVMLESWAMDGQFGLWALLKASVTFQRYYKESDAAFTWHVAGRQLCLLKQKMRRQEADSAPVLVTPEMYAALKPNKSFIRQRAAYRALEDGSTAALETIVADSETYDDI